MADETGDYNTIVKLKKELDRVKQELHESNRQLKLKEVMLLECQQEIELIQSGENSEKAKLETKIVTLEETIAALRSGNSDTVTMLEDELSRNKLTIKELQTEIALLKQLREEKDVDQSFKMNEVIANLEAENERLKENFDKLNEAYDALNEHSTILTEEISKYVEENTYLKEALNLKKTELAENLVLIEKLNDELACLSSELGSLKNKPLDTESKGNSLFAEVDDRRVHLQQTIDNMKSAYIRLKQEHCQQKILISQLRKQNSELCDQWKKDIAESEEEQETITRSMNDTIKVLQESLEKLKKENESKPNIANVELCAEFQFYQKLIDSKQKEVKDLEQKLLWRSLNESALSISLARANKETAKWKVEALKLKQIALGETRSDIPCEALSSEPTIVQETKITEPIKKSCLKKITNNVDVQRDVLAELSVQKSLEDAENTQQLSMALCSSTGTEEKIDHIKMTESSEVEDKENPAERIIRNMRKGVAFCESTVEPSSCPVRRRGTRIFITK